MNRQEIETIADRAAEKGAERGVIRTLKALGFDTDNPLEVQRDQAHLRNHRKTCETVQRTGVKVTVSVLVTSMIAAVLAYFGFRGS